MSDPIPIYDAEGNRLLDSEQARAALGIDSRSTMSYKVTTGRLNPAGSVNRGYVYLEADVLALAAERAQDRAPRVDVLTEVRRLLETHPVDAERASRTAPTGDVEGLIHQAALIVAAAQHQADQETTK